MSDRSEIISHFTHVTGSNEDRAKFYLEAAQWQLEVALASFYDELDSMKIDDESIDNEASAAEVQPDVISAPAPSSSKLSSQTPKSTSKPHSTGSSKIRTLASLNQGNDGSSDEGEGQAFYAGGSDSSGQQILGPGKKKKDIVADMFKSVQEHGAEVIDPGDAGHESRPSSSFQGTGYRLGQSSDDSQVVSASGHKKSQPVNVVLKLWREGFSVDDGALRRYSDPDNKEFLESIRRGEVPSELVQEVRNEIQVQMEDHRHEDPPVVKPKVKAFSGKGNILGTPSPGSVPAASAMDEKAKQASEEAARNAVEVDPAKPQTSIQVRLADGSVLLARLNHSHTIADLRRFITVARPQYENSTFSLLMTFPRKELTDDTETVEKAGLLNAAVLQRLLGIGVISPARSRAVDVPCAVHRLVEQREGEREAVQEMKPEEVEKYQDRISKVGAQLTAHPDTCQSELLGGISRWDKGGSPLYRSENLFRNANDEETIPVENIQRLFLTNSRTGAPELWPDYVPSDFDTTESSAIFELSEGQKSVLNELLANEVANEPSDKLVFWNEIEISKNDYKIGKSVISSHDATSTNCLTSNSRRNAQIVCTRSEAGDFSPVFDADAKKKLDVMCPKDQTNKTFFENNNCSCNAHFPLCSENVKDNITNGKLKNVGISCNIPATVFRNERITSQCKTDGIFASYRAGTLCQYCSISSKPDEYNKREFESLNTNEVSLRKSSHLVPLTKVRGCTDSLNQWTSSNGDPYTFIERCVNSEENYETLCSFCSDVDGTSYEYRPISCNLFGGDRFFPCRSVNRGAPTLVQPVLTSPSDDACDLPVSFVTVGSCEEPSLNLIHEDIAPRLSSPVTFDAEKNRSKSGAKVCRLLPKPNQGYAIIAGGSVDIPKTRGFVFVSKRQDKSTVFSGRSRSSMTKRSTTAHGVRRRKERDNSLQSTTPCYKRRLKTSPEKL